MKNQVQPITYVDRLAQGSLVTLQELLDGPLAGLFGGVASEQDLLRIYSPRPSLPSSVVTLATGNGGLHGARAPSFVAACEQYVALQPWMLQGVADATIARCPSLE